MATSENRSIADADDDRAPEFYEEPWVTPPFQPFRAIGALILIASGFGLYEYVLVSFWSVPWMGIHDRIPWPAFAILAAAMVLSIAGLRLALGLYSPHAKLGFGLFAFLACIVVGAGGGRFVSYVMRATLNPPFTLKIAVGQQFPSFALTDQNDSIHHGPASDAGATLIYIYRGDYDPFARFELAELTAHLDEFRQRRHRYACYQHRSGRAIEDARRISSHENPAAERQQRIAHRTARSRATSSQRRARQRDTGVFCGRSKRRRAMDLHVALLSRDAAARHAPQRCEVGHRNADSIAAVASAGESAANIAPIDATPAGLAPGSADSNNSRARSGVIPPSAKTGIAPARQAALSPLAPHAGPAPASTSDRRQARTPRSQLPRARHQRHPAANDSTRR